MLGGDEKSGTKNRRDCTLFEELSAIGSVSFELRLFEVILEVVRIQRRSMLRQFERKTLQSKPHSQPLHKTTEVARSCQFDINRMKAIFLGE